MLLSWRLFSRPRQRRRHPDERTQLSAPERRVYPPIEPFRTVCSEQERSSLAAPRPSPKIFANVDATHKVPASALLQPARPLPREQRSIHRRIVSHTHPAVWLISDNLCVRGGIPIFAAPGQKRSTLQPA